MNEFVENFLIETVVEHDNAVEPQRNFHELPPIDIEDCDLQVPESKKECLSKKYGDLKTFVKKLMRYFDVMYPNFKNSFRYLVKLNVRKIIFNFVASKT